MRVREHIEYNWIIERERREGYFCIILQRLLETDEPDVAVYFHLRQGNKHQHMYISNLFPFSFHLVLTCRKYDCLRTDERGAKGEVF